MAVKKERNAVAPKDIVGQNAMVVGGATLMGLSKARKTKIMCTARKIVSVSKDGHAAAHAAFNIFLKGKISIILFMEKRIKLFPVSFYNSTYFTKRFCM